MKQHYTPIPASLRRSFANYYEREAQGSVEKQYMEPMRKQIVGQATGQVLEVGAGNGLNFAYYKSEQVERVEATEPDEAMLKFAHKRAATAPIPAHLTQASVEHLPFADASFDSVVCTLVFCSVQKPLRGLQEIKRVLKPGGKLLMIEHVRSQKRRTAFIQDLLTPLTRLFAGNCHWNRNTERLIQQAGFQIITIERQIMATSLLPVIILQAR